MGSRTRKTLASAGLLPWIVGPIVGFVGADLATGAPPPEAKEIGIVSGPVADAFQDDAADLARDLILQHADPNSTGLQQLVRSDATRIAQSLDDGIDSGDFEGAEMPYITSAKAAAELLVSYSAAGDFSQMVGPVDDLGVDLTNASLQGDYESNRHSKRWLGVELGLGGAAVYSIANGLRRGSRSQSELDRYPPEMSSGSPPDPTSPMAMADSNFGVAETPTVTFKDVGGIDSALETIQESVFDRFVYPEIFDALDKKSSKGLLLYGPPGCGKTLAAKAIANELGHATNQETAFFAINAPEIFSIFVGASEAKLRALFGRARAEADKGKLVVIFMDELDGGFPTRDRKRSEDTSERVVTQLLGLMDGFEETHNVLVIGATNRRWAMDAALLREGRFGTHVFVARPDEKGARDILSVYLPDSLRLHPDLSATQNHDEAKAKIIDTVVETLFASARPRARLTTESNPVAFNLEIKHLITGAMLSDLVEGAKQAAIRDHKNGTTFEGLTEEHFKAAAQEKIAAIESRIAEAADDTEKWQALLGEKVFSVVPLLGDQGNRVVGFSADV